MGYLGDVPISPPGTERRSFDPAGRGLGPAGARFGGWQLHRQSAAEYPGHDAYLVRVNYDLVSADEGPAAATVTFALPEGTVILDAATGPAAPVLDERLNVGLGAQDAAVRGVGTATVSLRHAAAEPSSYAAWLVLLVPAETVELPVVASVSLDYPGHAPVSGETAFVVRLPAQAGSRTRSVWPQEPVQFRMGFGIDLVRYTARTEPVQFTAQQRIVDLVYTVLDEVSPGGDRFVQAAGDGVNVFLPVDIDYRVLADLRRLMTDGIDDDNSHHIDRQRFRMAVDIGPCRLAANGCSGPTIVSFCRLLDSDDLRRHMDDHPKLDLGLIVSDLVFRTIVSQDYPGLASGDFVPVDALVKGYQARAWIWTPE